MVSETSLVATVSKSQAPIELDSQLGQNGSQPRSKNSRTLNHALQAEALPIYEVASLFKERCLRQGTSLLWPSERAWTSENLDRVAAVFSVPTQKGQKFYKTLKGRLAAESADVHRVVADLIAVYHLFPADITSEAKVRRLKRVLRWKFSEESENLTFLERPYASFIGTTGRIFFSKVEQQLSFFVAFAGALRKGTINIDSLAAMKAVAAEACKEVKYSSAGRNVLLHLLFPGEIEGILSQKHRRKIAAAFAEFRGDARDSDDALRNIRTRLTLKFGSSDFDYYRPDIRSLWDLPTRSQKKIKPKQDRPGDDKKRRLGLSLSLSLCQEPGSFRPARKSAIFQASFVPRAT